MLAYDTLWGAGEMSDAEHEVLESIYERRRERTA